MRQEEVSAQRVQLPWPEGKKMVPPGESEVTETAMFLWRQEAMVRTSVLPRLREGDPKYPIFFFSHHLRKWCLTFAQLSKSQSIKEVSENIFQS